MTMNRTIHFFGWLIAFVIAVIIFEAIRIWLQGRK